MEDLQSAVEALRRRWRALYLPILGALAQSAPEDIPNVYQQRGTWAVDTVRLMLWGKRRGLTLRQRLHFWETALFYIGSFAWPAFFGTPVAWFPFDLYSFEGDPAEHAPRFVPFGFAVELFLIALTNGRSLRTLWRSREVRLGLAPVSISGSLRTILGGRNRKPRYRVTRKFPRYSLYWRETLPQVVAFSAEQVRSIRS